MTWFGIDITIGVTLWGWRIENSTSVTKSNE